MVLMDLQRRARDAAASARRNLAQGVVKSVHNGDSNLAMLAGSAAGQPLYTVSVIGRRSQLYDVFPVASPIPVQVGHWVFLSFLAGDLSRGAWITGLTHAPIPQRAGGTVDTSALSVYITTGPTLPMPAVANRVVRVEDAFVVTARQMRLAFTLALPAAPGKHDVDQTSGANPTRRTGSYAGATVQWQADARLVDGVKILGSAVHGFVGRGAVTTAERIEPNPAGLSSRWRYTQQLLTPQAVWFGVFDTQDAIGKGVALELYLTGTFVNPSEYTLPGEWGFSSNEVRYSAVEDGSGSGLPT